MNNAPVYRRRRRITVAVLLTIAALVMWLTGPNDGTDGNDPCFLTPNTPTCTMEQNP